MNLLNLFKKKSSNLDWSRAFLVTTRGLLLEITTFVIPKVEYRNRKLFCLSFKVTASFTAPLLEPQTPKGKIGQSRACLGKFGHAHRESSTISVFPLWYYIIIQKIIPNGEAVLEIFKFEKSSNLIGREHFWSQLQVYYLR